MVIKHTQTMTYAISALIVVASFAAFIFVPYFIGMAIIGNDDAIKSPMLTWLLGLLCGATGACILVVILCAIIYIHEILF